MIIDTHTHLVFKAYDNDRKEILEKLKKDNIFCIEVGTSLETSKKAIELAEKNKNIFSAIGLHPLNIKTDLIKLKPDLSETGSRIVKEDFNKEEYKKLLRSPKIVAIGEIGLDYYYRPKTKKKLETFKEKQKEVFKEQLEIAHKANLPVIIHCRMAHLDVLEILNKLGKKINGVIHCFTGSLDEMRDYLKLGFYIGFNGIIFKMNLDEAIKKCPLEKILVETDCPYLTPPQENGRRNEPCFVKYIIEKISKLKNLKFEQVTERTFENAQKLFRF